MQKFLDKNKGKPVCDEIIEFFFKIRHFINMYDCIDEKYVIYAEHIDDGDFALHLYCVDPSGQLSQRLSQGISTIMFSATLLPVNYLRKCFQEMQMTMLCMHIRRLILIIRECLLDVMLQAGIRGVIIMSTPRLQVISTHLRSRSRANI